MNGNDLFLRAVANLEVAVETARGAPEDRTGRPYVYWRGEQRYRELTDKPSRSSGRPPFGIAELAVVTAAFRAKNADPVAGGNAPAKAAAMLGLSRTLPSRAAGMLRERLRKLHPDVTPDGLEAIENRLVDAAHDELTAMVSFSAALDRAAGISRRHARHVRNPTCF
ncbi:hypothetical protein IGS74_18025 [Aureimonas sp. OT7]|uniref:hypothetical protein n=1 Tax=Aureimonas sp. OT7 TaxID=2816454 RepID=UPI001781D1AD|nr:hypothetical protein [Aureimonas sp. OT7]QOG06400.1 hypothetical protein IGS74_18025 [Aureimonas sp. OT7]